MCKMPDRRGKAGRGYMTLINEALEEQGASAVGFEERNLRGGI